MESNKMIMVIGSLNANPADREMTRGDLRSVQLIGPDKQFLPISYFQSWGELGMSSMAVDPANRMKLYFATSSDIYLFDLESGTQNNLHIDGLNDIHEISAIGENLWITNTKHDEIVSVNIQSNTVQRRVNLADYSCSPSESGEDPENAEWVDKFHVNLVFQGFDGDLYVLVHHTSGRQIINRISKKLLKRQGNGGVVNIDTNTRIPLNFKAPHSVRLVNGEYWVFDSGHFELKVFDKSWKLKESIDTKGFGRGGEYSPSSGIYYAGVSATRKRYLGLFPGGDTVPNMIQVIDTSEYKIVDTVPVPGIEQINNVYCIDQDVADRLLQMA